MRGTSNFAVASTCLLVALAACSEPEWQGTFEGEVSGSARGSEALTVRLMVGESEATWVRHSKRGDKAARCLGRFAGRPAGTEFRLRVGWESCHGVIDARPPEELTYSNGSWLLPTGLSDEVEVWAARPIPVYGDVVDSIGPWESGGLATVRVEADGSKGPVPQAYVSVFFYPFDRDSVFKQLDEQAADPRPEIPQELIERFGEIRSLQNDWREKEGEWTTTREEMQALSNRMLAMYARARGTREYMTLYERFEQLESLERRQARDKEAIFNQFTALQEAAMPLVDSYRETRDTWEDEVYAGYFDLEHSLTEGLGLQVIEDTTDNSGYVSRFLPPGDWWVKVRIRVPVGERTWNIKIDGSRDTTLWLSAENGEERARL